MWQRFHEWIDAVKKRESVWRTRSEEKYYEQAISLNTALTSADLSEISE